jgi:hypothetical protein
MRNIQILFIILPFAVGVCMSDTIFDKSTSIQIPSNWKLCATDIDSETYRKKYVPGKSICGDSRYNPDAEVACFKIPHAIDINKADKFVNKPQCDNFIILAQYDESPISRSYLWTCKLEDTLLVGLQRLAISNNCLLILTEHIPIPDCKGAKDMLITLDTTGSNGQCHAITINGKGIDTLVEAFNKVSFSIVMNINKPFRKKYDLLPVPKGGVEYHKYPTHN